MVLRASEAVASGVKKELTSALNSKLSKERCLYFVKYFAERVSLETHELDPRHDVRAA